MLRSFLILTATAYQCLASSVPDESVLPEWTKTFAAVLAARKTDFRRQLPNTSPVTDEDLLKGDTPRPPDESLKLLGADTCSVDPEVDNAPGYNCYFYFKNLSAKEAQDQFIRLVRLVEKATGGGAKPTPGMFYLKPDVEKRHVYIMEIPEFPGALLSVEEHWAQDLPRVPSANSLRIRIAGATQEAAMQQRLQQILGDVHAPTTAPGTQGSGASEAYSPLPRAVRMGSSGVGPASVNIANSTRYTLTLVYEGASTRTVIVAAGGTNTVELPAGIYRIQGTVNASNVLPFRGDEVYGAGDRMKLTFYIQ
jgi:hypothetical protein